MAPVCVTICELITHRSLATQVPATQASDADLAVVFQLMDRDHRCAIRGPRRARARAVKQLRRARGGAQRPDRYG